MDNFDPNGNRYSAIQKLRQTKSTVKVVVSKSRAKDVEIERKIQNRLNELDVQIEERDLSVTERAQKSNLVWSMW